MVVVVRRRFWWPQTHLRALAEILKILVGYFKNTMLAEWRKNNASSKANIAFSRRWTYFPEQQPLITLSDFIKTLEKKSLSRNSSLNWFWKTHYVTGNVYTEYHCISYPCYKILASCKNFPARTIPHQMEISSDSASRGGDADCGRRCSMCSSNIQELVQDIKFIYVYVSFSSCSSVERSVVRVDCAHSQIFFPLGGFFVFAVSETGWLVGWFHHKNMHACAHLPGGAPSRWLRLS